MASVMSSSRASPAIAYPAFNRIALASYSVLSKRVYVGNLPYGVSWRELKDFMRDAGEVSFAEILTGPDGRSKGCGLVEFSTTQGAQKAISELTSKNLFGRPVFIREDRELQPRQSNQPPRTAYASSGVSSNSQIFISGLPLTVTWETLKETFQAVGTVLKGDIHPGRGTAVVHMSSPAEAANAIVTLNGTSLEGSSIQVREDRHTTSYPSQAPRTEIIDPANQEPTKQVFVNNLPYATQSAELLALSPNATNAEVLSIGGRSRGVGILEFSSLEASAAAIQSLQGQTIGGREIMVKYNERFHEFSDQAVGSSS